MMAGNSIEIEITELGYRELSTLTERMVKMGAAQSIGDVVRLIYEAGYHQTKRAVDEVEAIEKSGPRIALPN